MWSDKVENIDVNELSDTLKLVTDRMLQTRPRVPVCYRPYTKCEGVKRIFRQNIEVDFYKIFTDVNNGDTAFAETDLLVGVDTEINLMVKGNVSVCFKNKEILKIDDVSPRNEQQLRSVVIDAKAGKNKIVFCCNACEGGFGVEFRATHVLEPDIWANDILLWVRDTLPDDKYAFEQGIALSKLYSGGTDFETYSKDRNKFVFPQEPTADAKIDFLNLYAEESGKFAVALSYAKADGALTIIPHGEANIYVNKEKISGLNPKIKAGDEIVVVAERTKNGWGFDCDTSLLYIPFLQSDRKCGDRWLLLGAFTNGDVSTQIQFTEPYVNADKKQMFWRFADKDTYLRPYIDSCFFAQWTYALMVGEMGILNASKIYGEYYSYFYDSMSTIADFFKYIRFEKELFGTTTFMPRAAQLTNLDAIGAAGMILCELYRREADNQRKEKIMYVIKTLEERIMNHIPRMKNGTFYRVQTMWADDTFMSCPFLIRLGDITGDEKYYKEAVRQLLNYKDILFMQNEKLYSHIYYPETKDRNNIPWGRGNGWVFFALEDALEHIPQHIEGYSEIKENFKAFAEGLKNVQSESGMWRQVLNLPNTYLETSGTCIFAIGMLKAVNAKILGGEYGEIAMKAVLDTLERMIDEKGNVHGVCKGSQCSRESIYYEFLNTNCNDDHGTGLVMTAVYELIKYMQSN